MEKVFHVLAIAVVVGVAGHVARGIVSGSWVGGSVASGDDVTDSLLLSQDGGTTFIPVSADRRRFVMRAIISAPDASGMLYMGTDKGLMISDDEGASWHSFVDLRKELSASADVFALAADGGTMYAGGERGGGGFIYETTDRFFTVTPIFTSPKSAVRALAFSAGRLMIGLADGRMLSYDPADSSFRSLAALGSPVVGIYTDSGGMHVATKSAGMFVRLASGDFRALEETARAPLVGGAWNRSFLYLASAHGLLRSADSGNSWTLLPTVTPNGTPLSAIAVSSAVVIVGAERQLYETRDNGLRWRLLTPTPLPRDIAAIAIREDGGVFVGMK
ncbi:MAG: hypothetical protein HYS43_00160 [Candidatus Liptonbacteria bacterium]|nr:hypothetical protein [Candidatus Liptonbacteria bacterium]